MPKTPNAPESRRVRPAGGWERSTAAGVAALASLLLALVALHDAVAAIVGALPLAP